VDQFDGAVENLAQQMAADGAIEPAIKALSEMVADLIPVSASNPERSSAIVEGFRGHDPVLGHTAVAPALSVFDGRVKHQPSIVGFQKRELHRMMLASQRDLAPGQVHPNPLMTSGPRTTAEMASQPETDPNHHRIDGRIGHHKPLGNQSHPEPDWGGRQQVFWV
jgi:putative hemolysin